ncbi:uncharacterized protein LOC143370290 isoform X2 [Andrena cerasifolii]|uniref:uncharacterized protein LOC143370290 isoform X2 n=1 Tax=Andrena cerasifolii TaxID=2819439 RepID=UPI004037ACDF
MSRVVALLLFVSLNAGLSHGMECTIGHSNFLEKFMNSCPGLTDHWDKSYCCYDFERSSNYCCTAAEFGLSSSWIILTGFVTVAVVVSLIVFCISCLCCRCCPWYRRRHRGTVYGRVQGPRVVHVIQSSVDVPRPTPFYTNASNATNATNSTGIVQPPPYTAVSNEMYPKQAPHNPDYYV